MIGECIGREKLSDKGIRKAEESAWCRLHVDLGIII